MAAKNKLALTVQYTEPHWQTLLPRPLLRRWTQAALLAPAELTLRWVDAAEAQALNRAYRGKDYATNVLTFAYDDDEQLTRADIVLCGAVLEREAAEQQVTLHAHAAHLVVHGVLHAQGYEHETEAEAREMEQREVEILARLGIADPYRLR